MTTDDDVDVHQLVRAYANYHYRRGTFYGILVASGYFLVALVLEENAVNGWLLALWIAAMVVASICALNYLEPHKDE